MSYIVRHIPAYVSGGDPEGGYNFDSLEELLAIPFVKEWSKDNEFHKFSLTEWYWGKRPFRQLMAELNYGFKWYVVGTIHDDYPDTTFLKDMPNWYPKEKTHVET